MSKCIVCGKASVGKCCSGACRAKYSREKRTPERTVDQAHAKRTHFTDACGNEHEIDYEGRRKDRVLLESWADGKGTYQQQCMGQLSRDYEKTKGVDMDRFLGEPSPQCGRH